MWYGIKVNGILTDIKWSDKPLLIWDFSLGIISSNSTYEIIEVYIEEGRAAIPWE